MEDKFVKLSVVMSSYNGEQYIKQQLESIQRQERQADEVLIRDDGSTDNTVNIVRQFIEDHHLENWHIKINHQNMGWRANFVNGMIEAKGDLIFFCDQDDIWNSNKLKVMENIMMTSPKINVLASNYQELLESGLGNVGPYASGHQLKQVKLYSNYMFVKAPGCTYCVRKEFATAIAKVWDESYPHDELAWCLALFTDSLYIYTEPLIEWRQHKTSAFAKESKSLKSRSKKLDWIKVSQKFNKSVEKFLPLTVKDDVTNEKTRLLRATDHYLSLRKKFYTSKNAIYGLRLVNYLKLYPRTRQYLADWYLVFFNRN